MRKALKMEFYKLFHGKGFLLALALGCLVTVLQFSWYYRNTYRANEGQYIFTMEEYDGGKVTYWYENAVLEGWMGCESYSPFHALFFLVLPLLAAIPYGISLANEWRSGYGALVIARCGRRDFFASKFIAVFIGGGLAVAVPLLLSLAIAACFLPAIPKDVLAMQSSVRELDMWGGLYCSYPVAYALGYVWVDFMFGGFFACSTLVTSRWFANRFGAVCFPLLLYCTLYYGVDCFFRSSRQYNPAFYIDPAHMEYSREMSFLLMVILMAAMLAALVGLYVLGNRKREVLGREG